MILKEVFPQFESINDSINVLSNEINAQAKSVSFVKGILEKKRLKRLTDDKQTFEAFVDVQEKKLENILLLKSAVIPLTAEQFNTYVKLVAKAKTLQPVFVQPVFAQTSKYDLVDLAPEPLEIVETEFTEADTTTIFEVPETPVQLAVRELADATAHGTQESFSLNVTLNEKQQHAKDMALTGKSFCLIGAAGTGKTTTQRAVAKALLQDDRLANSLFKTYDENGERKYVHAPSIAFCAFTRRAAANLAKAVLKDPELAEVLQDNIMTIHSLLEFEPEEYMGLDEETGQMKNKFRFAPKRTAAKPLDITHLVIEEASMLDAMTLWGFLYDALPVGVQIIFIGDINQLPPVFGPSILNYALTQLPVVELTQGYRNQGIILENAWNILEGRSLKETEDSIIVRGKSPTQVGQAKMAGALGSMFEQMHEVIGSDGLLEYDPEDCMILSPFNVQDLGSSNMNKWIGQFLGKKRNAVIHEIIAGRSKQYLAEGDKVMFNKMDGVILKIERNANYHGREPQMAGTDLTRFGVRIIGEGNEADIDDLMLDYSNFSIEDLEKEVAERKMQSSHVVTVRLDNGKIERISGAGDFAEEKFSLGYVLTCHKAQGSEWRKVFVIIHKDHAIMHYREWFYTAYTRARTKVTVFAKDYVINKTIANQRIKGSTIDDKIAFFNSGAAGVAGQYISATK